MHCWWSAVYAREEIKPVTYEHIFSQNSIQYGCIDIIIRISIFVQNQFNHRLTEPIFVNTTNEGVWGVVTTSQIFKMNQCMMLILVPMNSL